jgi:hypothetical protein
MKPEIKQLWIDALRSGEYIQGHGALKTSWGYCCLGVLCDLHRKHTGKGDWNFNKYQAEAPGNPNGTETAAVFLSEKITEWSGVENGNPFVKLDGRQYDLAGLNDGMTVVQGTEEKFRKFSFNEIADLIEEQL